MRRTIFRLLLIAFTGLPLGAQTMPSPTPAPPAAPSPQQTLPMPPNPALPPQPTTQLPQKGALLRLTVLDAEALALKNNPQVSVSRLLSLASGQVVREQRAAYYPVLYGSLTGVDALEGPTSSQGNRIAAGLLNNPAVFPRAGLGVTLSQLITDFGRTNNLVAAAALRAKAENMNALATADQIKLAVDQAFYNSLQAKALLQVAEETVQERQVVSDEIRTLYQNKLRSEVDVSFADANLAQAELLLLDAQNNYQASFSLLSEVLGYATPQPLELLEADTTLEPPPDSVSELVEQAFRNRPEIAAQDYEVRAAQHFQKAERDLLLPTVEALGTAGHVPVQATVDGVVPFATWYGGFGVNVNIPIFNGFLYPARSKEAALRAQATGEQLRDWKDRIAKDVQTGWLNSITAYKRISVSKQFVDQTNLALQLSETRYHLGLSSIVELSQAQLQQTQAQIEFAAARYQYRISQAVLRFQIAAP